MSYAPLVAAGAQGIMPKGKAGEIVKIAIIIRVVFLLYKIISGGFGFFNSILESFGLKETEEGKKLRENLENQSSQSNNPTSPWSPTMYKNAPSGARLKTQDFTATQAYRIWDSVGTFSDNAEQGFAAIKTMPTQAAVSYLADIFQQNFKKDLISWLRLKYDTDYQKSILTQIYDYVNKLPKY